VQISADFLNFLPEIQDRNSGAGGILKKFKKYTLFSLIILGLLIWPIRPFQQKAKAATPKFISNPDWIKTNGCAGAGTEVSDSGFKVELSEEDSKIVRKGPTTYEITLKWDYTVPSNYKVVDYNAPLMEWSKSDSVQGYQIGTTGPQSGTVATSQMTKTFTVELNPESTANWHIMSEICFRVDYMYSTPGMPVGTSTPKYFKTSYKSNSLKMTAPANQTQTPEWKAGGGGVTTSPEASASGTGASGSECHDRCSVGLLARFTPSGAIQQAVCDMQCTIIGWMANIVSIVIENVLFKALGI